MNIPKQRLFDSINQSVFRRWIGSGNCQRFMVILLRVLIGWWPQICFISLIFGNDNQWLIMIGWWTMISNMFQVWLADELIVFIGFETTNQPYFLFAQYRTAAAILGFSSWWMTRDFNRWWHKKWRDWLFGPSDCRTLWTTLWLTNLEVENMFKQIVIYSFQVGLPEGSWKWLLFCVTLTSICYKMSRVWHQLVPIVLQNWFLLQNWLSPLPYYKISPFLVENWIT